MESGSESERNSVHDSTVETFELKSSSSSEIGTGAVHYRCVLCDYETSDPAANDLGSVRGNTQRFLGDVFPLWRCPKCQTIHSVSNVDIADIYKDYPLNTARRLDMYARGTLNNLLRRLVKNGLKKTDRVLDFGCGNGVSLRFYAEKGYSNVVGYDPYVSDYDTLDPANGFDWVVSNDVIEHCNDPYGMMRECIDLLKPDGVLYVGTADSEGVESMRDLEQHIMRLHQPFHRVIMTQSGLLSLGQRLGLELVTAYTRSYMDTLRPFVNYRFLDEFNKALGHNLDAAFDPAAGQLVVTQPRLLFFGLFGYFFPSAREPAVLWRKPG